LSYSIVPHRAYPHQLSGGQKQRLAIARSLIMRPQLLILDEPFASLDPHASREIQESLARFHASERPTICFVSHDLDHCLYLADRIILLHGSPTKVVSEFYVSTPRPRSRTAILEPASLALRAAILSEEEKLYATRRR
jgi:ABC-type nitrate/sulfonate/bicarbonate transport system ATPase subunit